MENWFLEVNPHAVKCEKFRKALSEDEEDTFTTFVAVEGHSTRYFIRGQPDFVDDGDGHYDDMTGSEEIFYCPFCGTKL